MLILSHSRAAQVAYQDLLRLHLDDRAADLIGSVVFTTASAWGPR
ncbi:hypothetical protein [Tateyamaria sp. ANG-S1]